MCDGDFKARLGNRDFPGLHEQESLLGLIQPGVNPYHTGDSLPGNSPVFVGRKFILHQIVGVLRKPGKPGCVNLLGERRIGKGRRCD